MRRFYFLLLSLALFSQCKEPAVDWVIIQENAIIPQPAKAAVKKGVKLGLSGASLSGRKEARKY